MFHNTGRSLLQFVKRKKFNRVRLVGVSFVATNVCGVDIENGAPKMSEIYFIRCHKSGQDKNITTGREPWSSCYGRRPMFKRPRVRIQALDTN